MRLEDAVRRGARHGHSLRDALVIGVGDLLAQVEIFQRHRAAVTRGALARRALECARPTVTVAAIAPVRAAASAPLGTPNDFPGFG